MSFTEPKMCLKQLKTSGDSIGMMVLKPNLYLAQNVDTALFNSSVRLFKTPECVFYNPICDDFGPMNMSSVINFVKHLQTEIESHPQCKIVYCVPEGRRELTNATFLLGAYLIIKHSWTSSQVVKHFTWIPESLVEPFRDATFAESDFDLTLMDCWKGLEKGKEKGWIDLPSNNNEGLWGCIELEEYEQYDDPLDGDLHEVVPRKFVAFKGPMDLEGSTFKDDNHGYRHFSPEFYVPIFKIMGVKAVVRLNEAHYDASAFTSAGIAFHDLEFEDCRAPPVEVICNFCNIMDRTDGAIAIHCKAGLGRTGTLIALHLMRSQGFTAREAIGWLRIMRPGSVIGEQQRYLCEVEKFLLQPQAQRLGEAVAPVKPEPANAAAGQRQRDPQPQPPAKQQSQQQLQQAQQQAQRAPALLALQVAQGIQRRASCRAGAVPAYSSSGSEGPAAVCNLKLETDSEIRRAGLLPALKSTSRPTRIRIPVCGGAGVKSGF